MMCVVRIVGVFVLIFFSQHAALGEQAKPEKLAQLKALLQKYDPENKEHSYQLHMTLEALVTSTNADEAFAILAPYANSGKIPYDQWMSMTQYAIDKGVNVAPLAEAFISSAGKSPENYVSRNGLYYLLIKKADENTMAKLLAAAKQNKTLGDYVVGLLSARDGRNASAFQRFVDGNGDSSIRFAVWSAQTDIYGKLSLENLAMLESFRNDANPEIAKAAEAFKKQNKEATTYRPEQLLEGGVAGGRLRKDAYLWILGAVGAGEPQQVALAMLESPDPALREDAWECVAASQHLKTREPGDSSGC